MTRPCMRPRTYTALAPPQISAAAQLGVCPEGGSALQGGTTAQGGAAPKGGAAAQSGAAQRHLRRRGIGQQLFQRPGLDIESNGEVALVVLPAPEVAAIGSEFPIESSDSGLFEAGAWRRGYLHPAAVN